VQTDREEIQVILGPVWYLEQQKLALGPGDLVEIRGSRIIVEERPYLIAARVKKGKKTWQLRNREGIPAWSRRPRR
jgi:hypothetical protein